MRFTGSDFVFVDDGAGGQFLEGTFELTVIQATGVYRPFVGGHNHMVDKLHFLASGDVVSTASASSAVRKTRKPLSSVAGALAVEPGSIARCR